MRLSRRRPPEEAPEGTAAAPDGPAATPPGPAVRDMVAPDPPALARAHSAELAASLVVEDELESRIRLPTDLLRCVTAGIQIAVLVGIPRPRKPPATAP